MVTLCNYVYSNCRVFVNAAHTAWEDIPCVHETFFLHISSTFWSLIYWSISSSLPIYPPRNCIAWTNLILRSPNTLFALIFISFFHHCAVFVWCWKISIIRNKLYQLSLTDLFPLQLESSAYTNTGHFFWIVQLHNQKVNCNTIHPYGQWIFLTSPFVTSIKFDLILEHIFLQKALIHIDSKHESFWTIKFCHSTM